MGNLCYYSNDENVTHGLTEEELQQKINAQEAARLANQRGSFETASL
jgi:hypothetical protein